jgi:hypothetical protein
MPASVQQATTSPSGIDITPYVTNMALFMNPAAEKKPCVALFDAAYLSLQVRSFLSFTIVILVCLVCAYRVPGLVLYVSRVGMVCVSEHPMLSELERKISARKKKKKEGAWRGPRTLFCLFATATASVLLLLFFAPLGLVEASSTELVHAYGSTGADQARCVIEHSIDKGLVLAGGTSSYGAGGGGDFMLVKTDPVGVELWTKTYGGAGFDDAYGVTEHSIDKGLVLAGSTTGFGATGGTDIMLVKTDSVGAELWTKTYGGSGADSATSVIEHSIDTGLVVAGQTDGIWAGSTDMMLVKTNSVGLILWTKTYGGSADEEALSLIEHTIDTGLVLAGKSTSFGAGNWDLMLMKTNSVGVVLWTKSAGLTGDDEAYSVIEHSIDNGLVLAGYAGAGISDFLLVKFNSVGVELWTKTYGGAGFDQTLSLIEHSIDQGLVLAGYTDGFSVSAYDFMLVVQPGDGTSTGAGADATLTANTQTLTEADQTITGGTKTLTEGDEALADADQIATTTVIFPSQSQSPSVSVSISQTASATLSQTASQTATQTSSPSQTPSQTPSATESVVVTSELCADGTRRESCPSGHGGDDADEHFMIVLIILTPVFFTCCFVLVLCRQKKKEEEEETSDIELDRI